MEDRLIFDINGEIRVNYGSIAQLINLDNQLKDLEFCTCYIKPKITWFDGELFSLLSAILTRRKESNGLNILFDFAETPQSVERLFKSNGFFSHMGIVDSYETIVPVKIFKRNENENFMKYLEENFKGNRFPFSEDICDIIKNSLAEIFNNCEVHSETTKVFSAGQLFPKKGTNGIFRFCLTDTGIGIPTLVRGKIGLHKTSEEAIKWALEPRNTTKNYIGGTGLATLKENVEKNNGGLVIISKDACFNVMENTCEKNVFDFEGTSVIITLNCQG